MEIDNQVHTIKEFAEKHNITIATYYKDECKGDTPIMERKQLPVMLENLRSGDTVIVVECSRLHRSCRGLEEVYREIVEKKGCEFITLDEKEKILCTNGASDDLMQMSMKKIILTVMGTIAEFEKRNIGARTQRALAERKSKGKVLGRERLTMPIDFVYRYKTKSKAVTIMKDLGLTKTSYYKLVKFMELIEQGKSEKEIKEIFVTKTKAGVLPMQDDSFKVLYDSYVEAKKYADSKSD